jgi:putative FmdB family regulatory protein
VPLYEYECEKCGHRFEKIQKFSDPPVDKCPKCGSPVHKLMSSPAIQFKGTGWYVTDYARSGGGKEGKSSKDSGESRSSESKPAATTESKTETKSEKSDKPATDSGSKSTSGSSKDA